jgi:hypothetical protein
MQAIFTLVFMLMLFKLINVGATLRACTVERHQNGSLSTGDN